MTEVEIQEAIEEKDDSLRAAPFGRRSSPVRRVRLAAAGLQEDSTNSKPVK